MLSKKKLERCVKKKKTEYLIKNLKDLRYDKSYSLLQHWKDLIMALGRIGDSQAIAFIIGEIYYLSPENCGKARARTIADALKIISGDSAYWLVKRYKKYKSEKSESKYASNIGLVLENMGEFAVDAMLPLLDDTDPWWMFRKALEILARSCNGDKRVEEKVLELFQSDNNNIKYSALDALGEMRSKAAVPMILELYWKEYDKISIRKRIREALVKIGSPVVLPMIKKLGFTGVEYSYGDTNDFVASIFSMLGEIGDKRAVKAIAKYKCRCDSNLNAVKKDALRALGEDVVTFDDVSH